MVEYIYEFKDKSTVLFFNTDKNRHIFLAKNLTFTPTFALSLRIEKIIYRHLNITYKQWKARLNSHLVRRKDG